MIELGTYVLAAVLTFGHVFHRAKAKAKPMYADIMDPWDWCFPAAAAGLFWPLYWLGRGGITLMAPR